MRGRGRDGSKCEMLSSRKSGDPFNHILRIRQSILYNYHHKSIGLSVTKGDGGSTSFFGSQAVNQLMKIGDKGYIPQPFDHLEAWNKK